MTQRGAWTPQKVRERIRVGVLLKRLMDHSLGKLEMSQTQLKATEILLKKSLPDLSSVDATFGGKSELSVRWIKGDDERPR